MQKNQKLFITKNRESILVRLIARSRFFLVFVLAGLILFSCFRASSAFQPEAKITFTFDDGNKRIYTNAAPVLARYKFPAVLYGETGPLNAGEDWVMTWDQVRSLRDKYGWEIGSHTVWHPYLTQVSDERLIQELAGSKQDFAAQGIHVKSFASPYGDYNHRVLSAIARYYESHRAAWGGPNIWPSVYNDYEIASQEVKHTTSVATVKKWIDDAIANRQWLVLLFHDIVRGTPQEYQYNLSKFSKIVNYVALKKIKVVTVSDGLQLSSQPNLINNFTFSDLDANGWALNWLRDDEVNVRINTEGHGNVFGPEKSLQIIGGSNQRGARTELLKINSASEYILKMYQNVSDLAAGGWGVWVDEYRPDGSWLGGKWLGGNYQNFVGERYYQYTPSSLEVDKIQLSIFTEVNSQLTLYIDSVELRAVGPANNSNNNPNLVENPSFENLTNGWADKWTRTDTSNVVIDTNNNGYGQHPKNSLKIIGGADQRVAMSSIIPISSSKNYELSFYQKISDFISGGAAVWIDEFDQNGNWLSGSWLGGTYSPYNGLKIFSYKPTSVSVSNIQIHIFTEASSQLTLLVDAVELKAKQ